MNGVLKEGQGKGYQARINTILRTYMDAHRPSV